MEIAASKVMDTYKNFSITDLRTEGGDKKVWGIYQGDTTPLLKFFLKDTTASFAESFVFDDTEQKVGKSDVNFDADVDLSKIRGDYAAKGTSVGSYSASTGNLFSYDYNIGFDPVSALTITDAPVTPGLPGDPSLPEPPITTPPSFTPNGVAGAAAAFDPAPFGPTAAGGEAEEEPSQEYMDGQLIVDNNGISQSESLSEEQFITVVAN